MSKFKIILAVMLLSGMAVIYQNCGAFGIGSSEAKFSLLSETPVFEHSDQNMDYANGINQTGSDQFDNGQQNMDGNQNDNGSGTGSGDGGGNNNNGGGNPIYSIINGVINPPNPNNVDQNRTRGQMCDSLIKQLGQALGQNWGDCSQGVDINYVANNKDPNNAIVNPWTDIFKNVNLNPTYADYEAKDDQVVVTELPVHRMCSDARIRISGSKEKKALVEGDKVPILLADTLEVQIIKDDAVVCSITKTKKIKDEISINQRLDLSDCPTPVTTPFKISIIANGNTEKKMDVSLTNSMITSGSLTSLARKGVQVLYLENEKMDKIDFSSFVDAKLYKNCDQHASPLFIDLREPHERDKGYNLSAPWDGIMFDIHGKKAKPAPHTKKRISWLNDPRMGFIVLPNVSGQVLGIDQMFGDGTLGPDGQLANNGFEALAKFDGLSISSTTKMEHLVMMWNTTHRAPDGIISADDDIYSRLRLWTDQNMNGIADTGELRPLSDAGIAMIDLNYDKNYSEQDQYGNVVKYKSAARMTDGSLNLVFDLWFKVHGE